MNFFSNSLLVLLVAATAAASCSVIGGIGHKQFTFYKNDKLRKLVFALPKGKPEEKFRVGENDAKEQFYYFDDGSVFYVARHTTWQTVNKHRIDAIPANARQEGSAFSGKDKDGLFWKEIRFEEFRIGYAYVAADRVEKFNNALNSVKIR
jgi:hypothetical protein